MLKISSIEGNRQKLDGGSMFGNVPRALWERWVEVDAQSRIDLACRCLLVEHDNKKILFEVGIGCFFEPKMAERFGMQNPESHQLIENLKHIGIQQEEITHIVLSHLHFDHAGGLMPHYLDNQQGCTELMFPRAQYIVAREAFHRAKSPHPRDKASFIPDLVNRLKSSHRLFIVESDEKQIPQLEGLVEFFFSNGHTPGQMLSVIKGSGQNIIFCGDLIPGKPWVHLPITMGYDRFPEKLIDEKELLLKEAASSESLLFFTHDSEIAASKIAFDSTKNKYVPIEEKSQLLREVL